ncbi:biotin--[acetyl-CoA-carboxylase] ligase [Xylophilus sp.]|uniref:biotin--[acetyl-CoA-carboxylase] ligase n=1 Tax=Xylophilus sp. TaxID=2653893 RepID=UPI0013BA403C|nr:biotin--[acetyl-CoA-carboxylase] ligase [Xylophilus sp.]KAF1045180.1 MAG: Bifunctional ligase/repressor BirA [Xylophilus sp.]
MTAAPVRWPAEAIWEAVSPRLPGFSVEILPEIDSTSTELMRRARAGQADPVLLVAEQQTAGRGRLGRTWHGAAGASLTFSLGLPLAPAAGWAGLSLAVGVAVAEGLQPRPAAGAPRIGLKWPNDLWVCGPAGDRKLGGILVETASLAGGADPAAQRYAVVGVGVNAQPSSTVGEELRTPAASLQEIDAGLDASAALLRVAAPLVQAVLAFGQFGFGPFCERFAARDVLRDRTVTLSDGRGGTCHGVGNDGALLVHTPEGMVEVTSAEVSVRPAAAAR